MRKKLASKNEKKTDVSTGNFLKINGAGPKLLLLPLVVMIILAAGPVRLLWAGCRKLNDRYKD